MNKIKKIIRKGKVKILEGDSFTEVIKEKKKDLNDLFEYLSTREYFCFPDIISTSDRTIKYKYYDKLKHDPPEKDIEFISSVALLHYKTIYYKEVSRKKYKDIYNTLIDNIDYLKDYYNKLIENIDNEVYMSPSNYLLARNYSVILKNFYYIEKELNKWYNLVKDKTKERVCIIHNNLKKYNFLMSSKNILTGWDNYLVDTPILDLYKLYRNEYKNMDMESIFKKYIEINKLTKEEISLFNVMISMPSTINITNNEYKKVVEVKSILDYTYRTSNFINLGVFKELVNESNN